jgi:hypothetical protein
MSLDGTWNVEINTPMGVQKATVTLKTEGGKVTGSCSLQIEGTVNGNTATWPAKITQPFPMDLEFTVTAEGDTLTGGVKAGAFGTSPLKGTRA